MKLYHGSNQVIKVPDINKGRKFLDFGTAIIFVFFVQPFVSLVVKKAFS